MWVSKGSAESWVENPFRLLLLCVGLGYHAHLGANLLSLLTCELEELQDSHLLL